MSMVIKHNLTAMFANRSLNISNGSIHKTTEKLASGYRINRSADDAAGLAISEKMRKQIRGLTQASANLQDGVSLSQVADGALNEVHDMIHRINELAVKASNGTMAYKDREYINEEVRAIKKEISRVFRTTKFNEVVIFRTVESVINPEVTGTDTSMTVFHKGNGGIGGLEFNNVRYTISELQAEGLDIDDDGVAQSDFKAEFNLWDGETVKLSMKAGQRLAAAERRYEWKAEENGIYINNKLAAEWEDIAVGGKKGAIKSPTSMPGGEYSFTHHGMNIVFEVDSDLNFIEFQERINGTEDIDPATWDIKVGQPDRNKAADIVNNSSQRIYVTSANEYTIDNNYVLVADENGLAVKNTDTGRQTGYVAWSTFKDSKYNLRKDENGNVIDTNGGYPIVDWGNSDYSNGSAGITFDADAAYHFVSPDSNVPIELDFKLAESASLDEVIAALNGASLSNYGVTVPGTTSVTGTGVVGISLYSSYFASNFSIQRAYGRDFDDSTAAYSGEIFVRRSKKSGQPDASDVPTGEDGTYLGADTAGAGHSVVKDSGSENTTHAGTTHSLSSTPARYVAETVGDETHYYKIETEDYTETYNVSWTATDTWMQGVEYYFTGTFKDYDMNTNTRSFTETWNRTLEQSGTKTVTYQKYKVSEISVDDVPSEETVENRAAGYSDNLNGTELSGRTTSDVTGITTDNIRTASMTRISTNSSRRLYVYGPIGNDSLFAFDFTVDLSQAQALAESTGTVKVGDVDYRATGKAYRRFLPTENNKTIEEARFSNINVNEVVLEIPPRSLIIQSGADSDDQIEMKWYPLNLWSLDLYKTKILSMEGAEAAIDQCAKALQVISETREKFGAYQNRFEHAIKMTDNTVENTTYAESAIRDTDMAKEMVRYANQNVIAQAGQAMLANANQSKNVVLSLITQ